MGRSKAHARTGGPEDTGERLVANVLAAHAPVHGGEHNVRADPDRLRLRVLCVT